MVFCNKISSSDLTNLLLNNFYDPQSTKCSLVCLYELSRSITTLQVRTLNSM